MLKYLEVETEQGLELIACDSILNIQADENEEGIAYINLKDANHSRIKVEADFKKPTQMINPFKDAIYVAATTNWMKPISPVIFDGDNSNVSIKKITLECIQCKPVKE